MRPFDIDTDTSNEDLRIARRNIRAGKQTFSPDVGLGKHIRRCNAKVSVFVGVCVVGGIWLSDVPDYVRHGTAVVGVLLAVLPSIMALRERVRILKVRDQHMDALAAEKTEQADK